MEGNITLASAADAYHFHVGQPLALNLSGRIHFSSTESVIKAAQVGLVSTDEARALIRGLRFQKLRRFLGRLTWWRQRRTVVDAIDTETGVVSVVAMRWSWLRMKWVRS